MPTDSRALWYADREAYKQFIDTSLGRLFVAYEHALIAYWQNDSNEHISDRRLRELNDKSRTTRDSFVAKLKELANENR